MEVERCSVAELFQQARRHVVPLYQRPYVWSEELQWQPLWDDIYELVVHLLDERPCPPHFLGAVVRAHAQTTGLRLDARLVIDGQQRLTTLQMFLAALRDRVAAEKGRVEPTLSENLLELEKQLTDYTKNAGVVRTDIERFKVWPTNADRDVFQKLMKAGSRDAVDKQFPVRYEGKKNKKRVRDINLLVEAYRFFDDRIAELLAAHGPAHAGGPTRVLDTIVDALRHMMLVVIDLDESEDAQEIFETLNFRGAPLTASDLVKNFLFGRATAHNESAEELYAQHWEHFDQSGGFWKQDIVQGRLRRPIFDAFIEHYLLCKAGDSDSVSSRHLFQSFKAWWDSERRLSVGTCLQELKQYSETYRCFYEPAVLRGTAPSLASSLARIKALDTTTPYPLMLHLLVEVAPTVSGAERDSMLRDLESYLVRRTVVGLSGKGTNRVVATIIRDLRRSDACTPATFRERLAQFGGVDRWPRDDEFTTFWLNDPLYKRVKSRGIQMVLRAIHDALIGPRQEAIAVPDDLTVEHVMPQSWEEHWPLRLVDNDETSDESSMVRRERLIHTIGNLTLLTHALNPELSNLDFTHKQSSLRESVLVLNRYFDRVEEWDEAAILSRGRALLAHALSLWPGPG